MASRASASPADLWELIDPAATSCQGQLDTFPWEQALTSGRADSTKSLQARSDELSLRVVFTSPVELSQIHIVADPAELNCVRVSFPSPSLAYPSFTRGFDGSPILVPQHIIWTGRESPLPLEIQHIPDDAFLESSEDKP